MASRAWLIAFALLGTLGCSDTDTRPSVLLVTIDTLRADHLHVYGHELPLSPNIDQLARGGALFERAVAASAATAPSHATMMTSLFPGQHSIGVGNGSTRLVGAFTLADSFRSAGYATAAFVSNAVLNRRIGLDGGFDLYDEALTSKEENRPAMFERVAKDTTARAAAWLRSEATRPFFVWVHYQDPHGPYTPPRPFLERLDARPVAGERPLPVLPGQTGRGGIPAYQALEGLRLPSQYRHRYEAEILYTDHWVGRLVDDFREAAGRHAIVLLTADHGESLGEEDVYFAHGHATTPNLCHVPMVLNAPGIEPQRRPEPVSHVDVLPTLLELAGLAIPETARGLALGEYLRRGDPIPGRVLLCDSVGSSSAYRGDTFLRFRADASSAVGAPDSHLVGYRWSMSGRVSRDPGALKLAGALNQYLAESIPPVPIDPDRDLEESLRALGYLEPIAEPAP